jgi:alkylation response protein AidB-like acyl-CoA dehydrogenase
MGLGMAQGRHSVALTAAQETLAALSPSLFLSVEWTARVFGRLISVYGTEAQKARMLSDLEEGRRVGAVALAEGGMSLENKPMQTRATAEGDGFRLSGSKDHVLNAPIADWIAVAANFPEGRGGETGFLILNRDSDGLSVGPRLPTLGYRGAAVSALSVVDCHVPSDQVIGPLATDALLGSVRAWEDQVLTAASLGLIQRAYGTALKYAKEHESGGKPIIAYQEIGFKLAEMLTLWQTAQLLAYRAAWMAQAGEREAAVLNHCAKVFCSESAQEVAGDALQVLGAHGYTSANPAEESFRDAKYLQIAGTSSEISRMKIGDGVLASEA